jgi:hypothetical protein
MSWDVGGTGPAVDTPSRPHYADGVEYPLTRPAERRPSAETLYDLRLACDAVVSHSAFGVTFLRRLAGLVPPTHPLLAEEMPATDLAVAVLDPVRAPERYGGSLEYVEARWQQLGAWLAELGMPDDACAALVRAVARAARDVSGDDWSSATSSGWSALQLWMLAHLTAGAGTGPAPVE